MTLGLFAITLTRSEGFASRSGPKLNVAPASNQATNPEKSNFQGKWSIYRVDSFNPCKPILIKELKSHLRPVSGFSAVSQQGEDKVKGEVYNHVYRSRFSSFAHFGESL